MTKREAIVVSAYTGFLMCEFSDLHEYIEIIMERPVFTHELGQKKVTEKIMELAKPEFLEICENLT